MKATLIDRVSVGNTLGEGVLWDSVGKLAWWTDIQERRLYRYEPVSRALQRFELPERLGSFGFIEGSERIIAAFESGFAHYHPESAALEWVSRPEHAAANMRLNDGRVDSQGRFWAGSMVEGSGKPAGKLYCLAQGVSQEHSDRHHYLQQPVLQPGWTAHVLRGFTTSHDSQVRFGPRHRRLIESSGVRTNAAGRIPGRLDRGLGRTSVECAMGRRLRGALRARRHDQRPRRTAGHAAHLCRLRRRCDSICCSSPARASRSMQRPYQHSRKPAMYSSSRRMSRVAKNHATAWPNAGPLEAMLAPSRAPLEHACIEARGCRITASCWAKSSSATCVRLQIRQIPALRRAA